MRFDRSRSFKVIDLRTNRKPIYDFLLVIDCKLYLAPFPREVENHPTPICAPVDEIPFEFRRQTYHAKSWDIRILVKTRDNRLTSDDRRHIITIVELSDAKCNVRLNIDDQAMIGYRL